MEANFTVGQMVAAPVQENQRDETGFKRKRLGQLDPPEH